MTALRPVSHTEKFVFPVVVTAVVGLIVPDAVPLIGCLMFGNLLNVCGVTERLSKTAQNELMNIVTIFLGVSVGATASAENFLKADTIKIIILRTCRVLDLHLRRTYHREDDVHRDQGQDQSAYRFRGRFRRSYGGARFPDRGQKADPANFLLMHAMGPNVAGVIGSAVAAGVFLSMFKG